jgi:hypothetical protein
MSVTRPASHASVTPRRAHGSGRCGPVVRRCPAQRAPASPASSLPLARPRKREPREAARPRAHGSPPPRSLRRLGFSTGRRRRGGPGCGWARAGSPRTHHRRAARHVAPAAAEAAAAAALGWQRVRPRRRRQGEKAVLLLRAGVQGGDQADQGQVVVRGQLLLVGRVRVLRLVAPALPLQRDAGVVPAVRHGGHHGPAPGPARGQAAEGGAPRQAPRRLRPRHRHRRARALGGPPLRRGALPQAAMGRHIWRRIQEVASVSSFFQFWNRCIAHEFNFCY